MQKTGFTIEINGVEKYLADFKSLNDAYKENLETLKGLETGTEAYYEQQKIVAQLKNGVDEFNEALKDQRELLQEVPVGSLEELNKEYKAQLKLLKQLEVGSDEYNDQLKVVGKLKNEISDFNKAIKAQAKEYENVGKGVSEYKKLEDETRKLKNESKELAAQLVKLAKEGKENSDEFRDLEKQYKDTTKKAQDFDKQLKEIDETVGDSFRNVGNYKDSIVEAFEGAGVGVTGFGQKLKALAANPIMLLITAVVAGLKLLFDAFKQSKTGSELFTKAAGIMNGVMALIVKVVETIAEKASNLGSTIAWVFENPKEALLAFKDLIVQNIENRIQGLIDTFGYLGDTIGYIFSGEWKKAAASAGEAAKSFAQAATGASKESIEGMLEVVEETVKGYTSLEMAKKNAAKVENALVQQIEDLTTAYELANQAAGDSTLSLDEQSAAALKAMGIKEKLAALEIERAKNNLALVATEMNLNKAAGKSNESLYSAHTAALSELKAAQREYTLAVKENATQRREINRDAAERELDFLIDLFDKQKSINEQIINSDETTFNQKKALLEETSRLADKSFKEQEAVVQKFTDAKVNLDELVMISDAKVVQERVKALGVDDVIAGRLLEIVKERKQALQDFAVTELEISKEHRENLLETAETEEEIAEQIADIKYKQGLINETEYNKLILENELKRIEKELELNKIAGLEKEAFELEYLQKKLDNEELTDAERLKIQEDFNQKKANFDKKMVEKEANLTEKQIQERELLENERTIKLLEIKEAGLEKEIELIDRKFQLEEQKANEQYKKGEITEKEHQEKLREIEEEKINEKIDFLREQGDEQNELLIELLDEELEIIKSNNEKELEAEKEKAAKRIKIAKDAAAGLRDITNNLFAFAINAAEGNEQRQLELQRKQFIANKAFSASEIIIDTIVGAQAAYNSQLIKGDPTSVPRAIAAAVYTSIVGAARLAAVISQPAPMAEGGFTGRGSVTDETGERMTGIYRLHEGEYVAPRKQVEANPSLFAALDNNRRTGASVMTPVQRNNDSNLVAAISQMTRNITVVADSEEIVRLGIEKRDLKKSKNL